MFKKFQKFRHSRPFPDAWNAVLESNAPFRSRLTSQRRERLDQAIVHFVDSHSWEGCGGLEVREEHQATIAAHAMRLTMGFEGDFLDDVKTILLYPSAYHARQRQHVGSGVIVEGDSQRLGESWYHGPVILSWEDIQSQRKRPVCTHNVILHEFAHQLDYRNGSDADGIPPIASKEQAEQWIAVTESAFLRLRATYERGQCNCIDEYATTNPAEFFAVTTEVFFESPDLLFKHWPDLFQVMQRYYLQDPRIATGEG